MVLPGRIVDAAKDGDAAVVEAFLDAEPGAVNELGSNSITLLMETTNNSIEDCHVQCARLIIARGGDVNLGTRDDKTPLHYACYPGDCASSMVSLLLKSGARVNLRTQFKDITPLGVLIEEFDYHLDEEEDDAAAIQRQISRSGLEIMKLLLKAGASIDRCQGGLSAEAAMQAFLSRCPHYANDESFAKCREIVAGVRAHGSYKGLCAGAAPNFPPRALSARTRSRQDGQPTPRAHRAAPERRLLARALVPLGSRVTNTVIT